MTKISLSPPLPFREGGNFKAGENVKSKKMGNKNIDILNDLLSEVPHLLKCSYKDNEHSQWNMKVISSLEMLFGKSSRQYNYYACKMRSSKMCATEAERQSEYIRDIEQDRALLHTIIAGLEQEQKIKSIFKLERIFKAILGSVYYMLRVAWHWIINHKRISFGALGTLLITLMGTNWDTVANNWAKLIELFRSKL